MVEVLDKRVEKEIASLAPDIRADMVRIIELLEMYGPEKVGMPHVGFLGSSLWEIRAKGKSGIGRGIYVKVSGSRLIVVHAFTKKTQKTPQTALRLARKRAKEIDYG